MHSSKNMVPALVRRIIRRSIWRYRQATWRGRTLPDFIIIGAQKSGTTSLYHYLGQHPHLVPSRVKEIHWFDGGLKPDVDNFLKGEAWYRAYFPLRRHLDKHQQVFEASPLYLFNPLVPKRIAELIPQVKLIAILRNPVQRAISHYYHERRIGYESLPLMEALRAEEQRLKPLIDKEDYKSDGFIHYSYKIRGHYHEQIKRYLNHFAIKNILLINSEMLLRQPSVTLQRVFRFVGVDTEFTIDDLTPRHVASYRTGTEPEVYDYLKEYFRPHNQALYELVGENYGW